MKVWMVALAMASALSAQPALAKSAGEMTVGEFRTRPEQARTYMVLGAVATMDRLGVVCPHTVTIGEWRAALELRELDSKAPWIEALGTLMDERGCTADKGSEQRT